jgi:sugar (pentulose or hexulose) kinase
VSGVFIGLDLGTSAVKAVALTPDGTVCGRHRRSYPTARPQHGAAEQNPADWWDATMSALTALAGDVAPSTWEAIGLSAMLPTLVELDGRGAPLGTAITWEDGRAEPQAEQLQAAVGADRLYRVTGQRVDGRYLAPMYRRRTTDASETVTVAGAKDWLFAQLTGELLTDPSTATGFGIFDVSAGRWDPGLARAAGLPGVPPVAASDTALPMFSEVAATLGCRPGTPVVLGAADSVLGAYGLGVDAPGAIAMIGGTSTVVLAVSESPTVDPLQRYLVTPLAGPGYGLEMDVLSTGSAIGWLANLLAFSDSTAMMKAAAAVDVAKAPLFLPYLAPGEQGALWDPGLRGSLGGLHLGIGRDEIARGLITGIVLELRRCVMVLDEATGATSPIRVSGPSASDALMCRDLADATGRPVISHVREVDHSSIGAALLAALASTQTRPPVSAGTSMVEPSPAAASTWTELGERHDAAMRTAQHVEP